MWRRVLDSRPQTSYKRGMSPHTCDKEADVHLSVRLPESQKDELTRRAQAEDRSLSYYVKRLISDHLAVTS